MFANLLASQAAIAGFVALLVAVTISDVRRLTIPNSHCLAIVALYPIYVLTATHSVDWQDGAIVGAVALTIGFLLFAMRLAGGGDVKFFAAVSLWAGSQHLVELVFVTALVGGVVALGMLVHRWLTAPQKAAPKIGWVTRAAAAVNVFLGSLLLARARAAGVAASEAGPGSPATAGVVESNPVGHRAVGTLPYGAAISIGGIVVAAMLLMRG
jgi:prepilin peptidase CpaA